MHLLRFPFLILLLSQQASSYVLSLAERSSNIFAGPSHSVNSRGTAQCGPNSPCDDGSCCNSLGQCGYAPAMCKPTGTTKCISNCDAKTDCGVYSVNGTQKCGLNTCCSASGFCGTSNEHCVNGDPVYLSMPCQKGFGRCEVVPQPKCTGSTASKGRKIAYYQSINLQRPCQTISPGQINTTGLTHLIFAFASIDPQSFQITPGDSGDPAIYPKFTALKTKTMQTWIAIGGGGFSSPGSKTYTTWSDMVTSSNNRAIFIKALLAFISQWGFQGVDLDWEFPGVNTGGRSTDLVNLIALTKEIRAAFGKKYGLSIAIPPDFSTLQNFDPRAMEPYVDFYGLMAYDLHGPWEAPYAGAFIKSQTALPEIESSTLPLWYNGLTPSKINLGLAYYGRGYTVSDTSCMGIDCAYTQPSSPGPCTTDAGMLSLREIEQLIARRKLVPKLIPELAVKQITWDNQWMGYDDAETMAMKTKWADQRCLGGTSMWSIDMYSGAGSGDPNPKVWDGAAANAAANPFAKSPDATCGTGTKYTCLNSTFGNCCSVRGYCGSTSAYCGTGCQAGFGKCS